MTLRLYYDDCFLREFTARVQTCELLAAAGKRGSQPRYAVTLDRTAFYPASGGQPYDTGRLDAARVVEVAETADNGVVQITDSPLTVDSDVGGAIDWPRRFDHMQQHTGQHLLSAAFVELFGFATVSFHLGREVSTIDLAAPGITAEQRDSAEARVNEIIFENRPVTIRYGTAEELAALGIRKAIDADLLARSAPGAKFRAIEIADFDRQPCGGTHVRATGQVGLILLRKIEKQKQLWRVEFVCGGRTAGAARDDFSRLADAARVLTCGTVEVPAMVEKLAGERQTLQRQRQDGMARCAEFEAQALLASAAAGSSGVRLISCAVDGADADYLRLLGAAITRNPQTVALLASPAGQLLFAQSGEASSGLDMGALLREVVAANGGKGGGTRLVAQGRIAEGGDVAATLTQARNRFAQLA